MTQAQHLKRQTKGSHGAQRKQCSPLTLFSKKRRLSVTWPPCHHLPKGKPSAKLTGWGFSFWTFSVSRKLRRNCSNSNYIGAQMGGGHPQPWLTCVSLKISEATSPSICIDTRDTSVPPVWDPNLPCDIQGHTQNKHTKAQLPCI